MVHLVGTLSTTPYTKREVGVLTCTSLAVWTLVGWVGRSAGMDDGVLLGAAIAYGPVLVVVRELVINNKWVDDTQRGRKAMPKMFRTILWVTILVLMVATLCGIFLSPNFDRTVLWLGLSVTLGALLGSALTVLNLNRFLTLCAGRGAKMCPHEFVKFVEWWADDMIGPKRISRCSSASSSSFSWGSGASRR